MRTTRSLTVSHCIRKNWKNHARPPNKTMHAPPNKTMHTPPNKTMHAPPNKTMHAPPNKTTHAPPVNRITDACENITFANYVCGR